MQRPGTSTPYIIGFMLSVLLTLSAYLLVYNRLLGRWILPVIVTLALVQLAVQLMYFLHLGRETRPRWNLTIFAFAGLVVVILVFGSLWIMSNLNYHMPAPHAVDSYIIQDEGIQP